MFEHFTYVKISSITDFLELYSLVLAKTIAKTKTLVNCKINPLISSRLWSLFNIQPSIHLWECGPSPLTGDAEL